MVDLLQAGAPDAPAVVTVDGSCWTYRTLRAMRDRARRLLPEGGRPLVLLCSDRDPGGLVLYLASLSAGHVTGWLPSSMTAGGLRNVLAAFEPDRLVISRGQAAGWARELAAAGYGCVEEFGVVVAGRTAPGDRAVPADVALLLRTSGVTGAPKMVQLSACGLAANTAAVVDALHLSERCRGITSLPLHYTYGLSVLHSHLWAGASVVVGDQLLSGRSFWRTTAERGVTSVAGVPQTLEWLRHTHRSRPDLPLPPNLTVSGGALRRGTVLALDEMCRSRKGRFFVMYGQTEATARITVLPPDDLQVWPTSVGVPVGDWSIDILDEAGLRVPERQVGRIVLRGSAVMLGYAESRAELGATAAPDALDTGDLGYLQEGYLHIVGRDSRMIKPGGVRVALDDIERDLGEVANVAVCGRPGERAVVFHDSAADVQRLRRRWDEFAAAAPVRPDVLEFRALPALPITERGKVDYRALMIQARSLSVAPVDGRAVRR